MGIKSAVTIISGLSVKSVKNVARSGSKADSSDKVSFRLGAPSLFIFVCVVVFHFAHTLLDRLIQESFNPNGLKSNPSTPILKGAGRHYLMVSSGG